MIQITHKDLETLVNKHFENIVNYINQKNTKYNLDDINCNLVYVFDKDLEQIVKSTPEQMKNLIETSSNINIFKEFKDLYEVFRDKWALELVEKLDISVCPYCNREYIFKFTETKKKGARTLATFDHYYSKTDYPFLAISFYNLIPCCHICNSKFKHKKDFYKNPHLHPYEDDFNSLVKFQLTIKDNSFYYNENGFDIKIASNNPKVQNSIETFRLNELYQNHKDIVLELIQKREIYPDSYIDELAYNYSGLFKNREDLLRLITCGYVEDKDLDKRPLSKLVKDMSENLELI